jgi:hypothetical protein
MRRTDSECFEKLKTRLVKTLITKKVFYKNRVSGKYYLIAVERTFGRKQTSDRGTHGRKKDCQHLYMGK